MNTAFAWNFFELPTEYTKQWTHQLISQVTLDLPFEIEVLFESGSNDERLESLTGPAFTRALTKFKSKFDQKFESKYVPTFLHIAFREDFRFLKLHGTDAVFVSH